jgi:hypothetical protein
LKGIITENFNIFIFGKVFKELKDYRFYGTSGSVSRFNLNDTGKVTALYINRNFGDQI